MWLNMLCLSANQAESAHPKPSQIWQPLLGQSWLTFGELLPEHGRVSRHSAVIDPIALATWVTVSQEDLETSLEKERQSNILHVDTRLQRQIFFFK
ncbi:hypothetical protein PO909_006528 [Leuciscus waleckii]